MSAPAAMAAAGAPARAALALVPGLESGAAPLRLERLEGGSVNDSWRVDTAQGRFVLRIDGPATQRPGVDRAREQLLHAAAAAAGLAPPVRVWAAAAGVQVREYLAGRVWSEADFLQPAQLARLGERLALLHSIEAPAPAPRFDPAATALHYVALAGPPPQPAALAVAEQVRAAAAQVGAQAGDVRIVHGDLLHANLLEGERLWLLDWEYAQCADPIYDAACVLAYCPAARPQAARLLAAAGLGGAEALARLDAAVRVYEGLTWLWHRARGTGAGAA